MVQELGITLLISRGVRLLTANGDDLTVSENPSRKMMRQIAGAFAEYEKARLVHKLRHARERQRKEHGKCEGRKTFLPPVETTTRQQIEALAKQREATRNAAELDFGLWDTQSDLLDVIQMAGQ